MLMLCNAAVLALLINSSMVYANSAKNVDKVALTVATSCPACSEAEHILDSKHIKYTTSLGTGFVPKLYVNGKYIGLGVSTVSNYANSK